MGSLDVPLPAPEIYCSLCGVYIDFLPRPPRSEKDSELVSTSTPELDWLALARTVESEIHDPLSHQESNSDTELPLRRKRRDTKKFVYLGPVGMCRQDDCYTGGSFPVHDACWQVAARVAGKSSLPRLYDFLAPRCAATRIERVHVGGAELNQGASWIEREGQQFMLVNPTLAGHSDNIPFHLLSPLTSIPPVPTGSDIFSLLSPALIAHIFSFVISETHPWILNPHQAVHSLRHASPFVFRASRFFSNQFWIHTIQREMTGFVNLTLDLKEDRPTLYHKLWLALRKSKSLRNRRRIARFVAACVFGLGDVRVVKKGLIG